MPLFSLDDLHQAINFVQKLVPPTATHHWPLLSKRTGVHVYVKHENHTPIGAFKARGVPLFVHELSQSGVPLKGLVAATRGNHGQAVALAATQHGIPSVIVVPEGNSLEKNAAMEAFGGELIIAGADFEASRVVAAQISEERDYHMVPPFHADIVKGVATYAHELFQSAPPLSAVYAPIGMGSGICGLITVRDLLGLETEIIGVVAENAASYGLSFDAGEIIGTDTVSTFADGIACRAPDKGAFEIIKHGASRVIQLKEDEIANAMRYFYSDTHNIAEPAAAASLAGLIREQEQYAGRNVGVILSGSNVDAPVYQEVMAGKTPVV
jgi:threonine dehydratase